MNSLLTLWSNDPILSSLVWLVISISILYLGRQQAHTAIASGFRLMRNAFRMGAWSLTRMNQQLQQRNKEVLLAQGEKELRTRIERDFSRVNSIVQRDLCQYPALHRQIKDAIDALEEDYQESSESAPLPPAWGDVVSTVVALPNSGDPAVNKILENIKQSIIDAQKQTLSEFRKTSANRQQLLKKMQPAWRKLDQHVDEVAAKIHSLDERSQAIDEQMQCYEEMRSEQDKAASILTASSLTQFFISGLVLTIAVLGGLINFQLIAMPMSEMVGGTSYIGAVKTSDIAAMVIILIEIAMGLFLLESLRITHLFPIIGSMDDQMRRRMMIISFTILFILAGIESSLAYMRDLLAMDSEALQQSLVGAATVQSQGVNHNWRWIPSVGQMVMGFILPFALAFIAIPLESFIHALRTVIGLLAQFVLKVLTSVMRVLAQASLQLGKLIITLYDLIILVPLAIERAVQRRLKDKAEDNKTYVIEHE